MLVPLSEIASEILGFLPPLPAPDYFINFKPGVAMDAFSDSTYVATHTASNSDALNFTLNLEAHLPAPRVNVVNMTINGKTVVRTFIDIPKSAYGVIIDITSFDNSVVPWSAYPIPNRKFGKASLLQDDTHVVSEFINHPRTFICANPSLTSTVADMVAGADFGQTVHADAIGVSTLVARFSLSVTASVSALWLYDSYVVEYAPSVFFSGSAPPLTTSSPNRYDGLTCDEAVAIWNSIDRTGQSMHDYILEQATPLGIKVGSCTGEW